MFALLLLVAVAFFAFANGANDNFKGVASLFGSRTCGDRPALGWATITNHVSVGSLLGRGLVVTGQAKSRPVPGVPAAWGVTLPCAALLSARACRLLHPLPVS
jgi:phosphate/sulfate permease